MFLAHSIVADRYPITASNQTYMRLSSYPSTGTGTPQLRSRVMARSCSPPSRYPIVKFLTLGLKWSCWRTHSKSRPSKALSFMKKCSVSLITGGLWQIRHTISIKSSGSSNLLQLSHWSPRAPSKPQLGQVPNTNLSGRNRLSVSQ